MNKKVAFIIIPDATQDSLNELSQLIGELTKNTDYDFIVSDKKIECISKDDLIRVVDELKNG